MTNWEIAQVIIVTILLVSTLYITKNKQGKSQA